MKNYRVKIKVNDKEYYTLADILPEKGNLDILFIAKTPATISVDAGHYFQGKQGTMFWNRLSDYNILRVPYGDFADNHLLNNNYGITDIVKVPRDYGNEPTDEEYRQGLNKILDTIKTFQPKVIIFVYKAVLDKITAAQAFLEFQPAVMIYMCVCMGMYVRAHACVCGQNNL